MLGWIPLKQKPFIGTILNILTIGNVTDLTMHYIQSPDDLIIKIAYLVFGTICFGIGIGIYVGSGLGPGPRDGIMVGVSRLGPSIRATRIAIDFTAFYNWGCPWRIFWLRNCVYGYKYWTNSSSIFKKI